MLTVTNLEKEKMKRTTLYTFLFLALGVLSVKAQDTARYVGNTLSNIDYHHGMLSPAVGTHNIQVMRANREMPEAADDYGWTYNHQPMLAYWNDTFYLEYLSDSVGEHIPPSQSYLCVSKDGYDWSKPQVVFPQYKVPDGTTKEGVDGVAKDLIAIMHQRMGFYVSSNDRLLVSGFYGISIDKHDSPNDGNGIGRVVREIYKDGTWGPIYFVRYNHNWNKKNTEFKFYTSSRDKGFKKACEELMANPLMMQQWNEEADRDDPIIPMTLQFKAFNYYHLPDNRVVGWWKHALTAISEDGGKTWPRPERAPGFVNKNAKIWGQKTTDGKYATVYNPSEYRWPLGVSVSDDGLNYNNLLLVHGEISPMRYGGNFKSYGPQYVRGIIEGNGQPNGNDMWLTYSMNKEDIWVSKVPVPIADKVTEDVNEVFNELPDNKELDWWNIYCLQWAPVQIEKVNGEKVLTIKDKDRYDFALAERVIPSSESSVVEFTVVPQQNDNGQLHVEFQNAQGLGAIRLVFDNDSVLKVRNGYRYSGVTRYEPRVEYQIQVKFDVNKRFYWVTVNGKQKGNYRLLYRPVHEISSVAFRTGDIRRFPDADTPTDQDYDLKDAGIPVKEAQFNIKSFTSKKIR